MICVLRKHETLDDWALAELTRGFPEWQETYTEGTSRLVSLEKIIAGVGRGDDKEAMLKDLRESEAFDAVFAT